jgi:hypothetical protein
VSATSLVNTVKSREDKPLLDSEEKLDEEGYVKLSTKTDLSKI